MLKPLSGWFITIFENMYGSEAIFDIFQKYDGMFQELFKNNIVSSVIAMIMSVGISIMLVYFFMDLAEKVTSKTFTLEQFMKSFIKIFIAYFLISYSLELIQGFVSFSGDIADMFQDSEVQVCADFFTKDNNAEKFAKGIKNIGVKDSLVYIIKAFIPYILCALSNIIVIFIAISRVAEMVVRAIFSPFAVADCFQEGSRSNGVRYLKKFLAVTLQFAICVSICVVTSFIMKEVMSSPDDLTKVLTDGNFSKKSCMEFMDVILGTSSITESFSGVDHYWLRMGILFTKIGLLIKSLSFANDVVGV